MLTPSGCSGSVCVWRIHTNHPSVERLGSDDARSWPFSSWQHSSRDSGADCLQEGICSVWLRCHGYSGVDCSWRSSGGDRPHRGRASADRGSAVVSRCVPLSTVCWVVASHFCVTWFFYLPTCGWQLFATFGCRRSKLSVSSPLRKLGMSRWCGVSRVHARPHCAR